MSAERAVLMGLLGAMIWLGTILDARAHLLDFRQISATDAESAKYSFDAAAGRLRLVILKSYEPERDNPPATQSHRIVAFCVLPGVRDRFVITSDAKLVKITQAGEVSIIGVVTAPTSNEYLCMIRTENSLVGVNGNGHLVNTDNGDIIGALVPIEMLK